MNEDANRHLLGKRRKHNDGDNGFSLLAKKQRRNFERAPGITADSLRADFSLLHRTPPNEYFLTRRHLDHVPSFKAPHLLAMTEGASSDTGKGRIDLRLSKLPRQNDTDVAKEWSHSREKTVRDERNRTAAPTDEASNNASLPGGEMEDISVTSDKDLQELEDDEDLLMNYIMSLGHDEQSMETKVMRSSSLDRSQARNTTRYPHRAPTAIKTLTKPTMTNPRYASATSTHLPGSRSSMIVQTGMRSQPAPYAGLDLVSSSYWQPHEGAVALNPQLVVESRPVLSREHFDQGEAGPSQGGYAHPLQDYQMKLMLLEQQNKKRLLMARQEQESTDRAAKERELNKTLDETKRERHAAALETQAVRWGKTEEATVVRGSTMLADKDHAIFMKQTISQDLTIDSDLNRLRKAKLQAQAER